MDQDRVHEEDEVAMLDPDEAGEEIGSGSDAAMDSDGGEQEEGQLEIHLQNDSIAHFDAHGGTSIFCIAQHPVHQGIVATGGGDDSDDKGLGIGFVFDCSVRAGASTPAGVEREGIAPLAEIKGHTDSISAVTFTQPSGEYLVTAGLDGRLIANVDTSNGSAKTWQQVATVQEVNDINWLAACPCPAANPEYANTFALGAQDGSVWVYMLSANTPEQPLQNIQTYYVHGDSCTAGAWTSDGKLLVTVAEDNSLYAWDVWGEGAAAGLASASGSGGSLVGLTAQNDRFKVDGGLYSLAISPDGSIAATGGSDGNIRIVGLPRLSAGQPNASSSTSGAKSGAGARSKAASARQAGAPHQGQAGAILASLQAQTGSIETLDFSLALGVGGSSTGSLLLASGSVDGSIVIFDASRNFARRRAIEPPVAPSHASAGQAEQENDEDDSTAITKVEFVRGSGNGWLLTSAGYTGVLQRWDLRSNSNQGLVGEWRGHTAGGGGGGGIQGFVQGLDAGAKVVSVGDDGLALVFDMSAPPHA